MKTAHTFLPLLLECLIQGVTNQEIADTLNEAGYRTPGIGVLWTKGSVNLYRCKHPEVVEEANSKRQCREWAAIPMPKFPRIAMPSYERLLAGVPFFDSTVDGELDLPAPAMRRTR